MTILAIYLRNNLWNEEAKAIHERKGGDFKEILARLKRRISFGAIYDLFEDH